MAVVKAQVEADVSLKVGQPVVDDGHGELDVEDEAVIDTLVDNVDGTVDNDGVDGAVVKATVALYNIHSKTTNKEH